MMRRTTLIFFASTILGSGVCVAEPPQPLLPAFREIVSKEVRVGGTFVRGAMLGATLAKGPSQHFEVWLADHQRNRLCVYVRSIDGVYEAVQHYDVAATPAGRHTLRFEAPKLADLPPYAPGELVLDGRLGDDCSEPHKLVQLPLSWSPEIDSDALTLFINSDRNVAKVVVGASEQERAPSVFDCLPIPLGHRQRIFNQFCVLTGLANLDLTTAELRFFRLHRPVGPPRPLSLLAPGSP